MSAAMALVLGVDPGTRAVGFAVVEAGARPRMLRFGVIRLDPRDALPVRLKAIQRGLARVIARHRPAVVVLEDVFHGKNFQSALRIGEARGVALLCAALGGLPVVQYAPATVKQAVTGNGRADKRQVQRMVARLLGLAEPPEPLDASDALAIAFCHARRLWRGLPAARAGRGERPLQERIESLKRARKLDLERREEMRAKDGVKQPVKQSVKQVVKQRSGAVGVKKPKARPARAREGGQAGGSGRAAGGRGRPGVLVRSELPGVKLLGRGKVRDLYDLGEHLLVVATDRLSAFDVVLDDGIPDKGKVLTRLSVFWFETLGVPNHLVASEVKEMPRVLSPHAEALKDRAMMVRRLRIFPIECVVRGYLAGAGLSEYRERRSICGVPLPAGLVESDRLPEPIFTPTTKASAGHDEPMTFEEVEEVVGAARARELRDRSIEVYRKAAEYALKRGIIICDTKFEWGIPLGAPPEDPRAAPAVLADEVLTPDSSRFWPQAEYRPGRSQPSFDKQYVRDYLLSLKWDKRPPPPRLPPEVVEKTAEKYREIFERLTGRKWA